MSATISDSKLLLSAEATGFSTGKLVLPTAPAGTDVLVVSFRAWFENYAAGADGYDAANGWDNVDCFGLSFNGTFPARDASTALAAKTGFCGIAQVTTGATHQLRYVAEPANNWLGPVVEWASGQMLAGVATAPNAALTGATAQQTRLPHGALAGAQFAGVWVFKKAPGQSLSCSFGRNFESLANAEISKALTSAATVWDAQNQITAEATNWRTAEGTMQFPAYFLAKFTGGLAGCRLVIDHLKFDYWKSNT
ncbi:MAG TPA: hypothetical protein VK178_07265 [Opitutaceae bacterium]|nr:hypothetical protein [Opitutaceae bacterium]